MSCLCIVFFKRKTAYEMRISDWSSDVCSSDLTDDDGIHSTKKFTQAGLQAAAGVPLQCDEPQGFKTFRIGLFGLDKLHNIDRTVASLEKALQGMEQPALQS